MPATLGVNIDHVATLRQARGTRYPNILDAAFAAERGGADAITVHLREDRRHIQDRDVRQLREHLQVRLNMELAVTGEMVDIATEVAPADCCLVPERREELTTEGGLNVAGDRARIGDACRRLQGAGIRVSLFVDPEPEQLAAAAEVGADAVELHTGRYADAPSPARQRETLESLRRALADGRSHGLIVNAGHGLHYHNVAPVAALPGIAELNIGHAIVARAVFDGLTEAVAVMKGLLRDASP